MGKKLKHEIKNYEFLDSKNGSVKISSLFGKKRSLILIHNMGVSCPYCTLWADGLNGVLSHLHDIAGFVVVSNDDPLMQKKFASSRKWKFRMVSAKNSSFTRDMGFENKEGCMPGVSIFHKEKNGKIFRVAKESFGPRDKYCVVWHFLDLIPGRKNWEPKYKY